MKAIGTYAATHAGQVTSGMVYGAGLFSGLFWSLSIFPKAVLGIIVLLAGAELAISSYTAEMDRNDFSVTILTAGFAMWNVGAALLVGVLSGKLNSRDRQKV